MPISLLEHSIRVVARWVGNSLILASMLWLVTAPLLASQFHLLAPISVPASVLLVGLTGFTLAFGLAFFAFGFLPVVGTVARWPLEACLRSTASLAQFASEWEPLSRYVPGLPHWWIGGFYAAMIVPWLIHRPRPLMWAHVAIVLGWLLVGGSITVRPWVPQTLAYDQLAVGHGNCSVLRTPTGNVILFDCGSLSGPKVAERTIAPFLWSERVHMLDAIVISHADVDHFNGIVSLARRFEIGEVLAPESLRRSDEPAVGILLDELKRRSIPIRYVRSGDRIDLDEATIKVLAPAEGFIGANDNAGSLVLRIESAGRSILLTGDLEGDGLRRLLELPMEPTDVLIAPHHGAAGSNTVELAEWARPQCVISSEGYRQRRSDPLAVYADLGAVILRTQEDGEIAVCWGKAGLFVNSYRSRQRFWIRDAGR